MAGRSGKANVRGVATFAIVLGVVSMFLAIAPGMPSALAAAPLVGGAAIAFAITGNATLQLNAAPELRGRVMALYTIIFIGSTPIGGPIAGVVGEHIGPRVGLAGGAVIALLAGLWALSAMRGRREPTPELVTAMSDDAA